MWILDSSLEILFSEFVTLQFRAFLEAQKLLLRFLQVNNSAAACLSYLPHAVWTQENPWVCITQT